MSAHLFRSTVGMVSSGECFPDIDFRRMKTSSVVTGTMCLPSVFYQISLGMVVDRLVFVLC